jgi:hypothetical protein
LNAVPGLEDLAETLVVFLRKSVELNDTGIAMQDLDLVPSRRSAPLCGADAGVLQCEGLAATRWLPTQAILGKSALACLLRQVEVDVIETLAVTLR